MYELAKGSIPLVMELAEYKIGNNEIRNINWISKKVFIHFLNVTTVQMNSI